MFTPAGQRCTASHALAVAAGHVTVMEAAKLNDVVNGYAPANMGAVAPAIMGAVAPSETTSAAEHSLTSMAGVAPPSMTTATEHAPPHASVHVPCVVLPPDWGADGELLEQQATAHAGQRSMQATLKVLKHHDKTKPVERGKWYYNTQRLCKAVLENKRGDAQHLAMQASQASAVAQLTRVLALR